MLKKILFIVICFLSSNFTNDTTTGNYEKEIYEQVDYLIVYMLDYFLREYYSNVYISPNTKEDIIRKIKEDERITKTILPFISNEMKVSHELEDIKSSLKVSKSIRDYFLAGFFGSFFLQQTLPNAPFLSNLFCKKNKLNSFIMGVMSFCQVFCAGGIAYIYSNYLSKKIDSNNLEERKLLIESHKISVRNLILAVVAEKVKQSINNDDSSEYKDNINN